MDDPFDAFADGRPAERWDPLGAANDDADPYCDRATDKLRLLEDEQDLLNSSLFALTTHFAQVQFRLRQIVNAPNDQREDLLRALEEFAFRGIPDVSRVKERMDEASLGEAVRLRRSQQKELIDRLKLQLRELEQYAFDSGEAGVPQEVVVERQRIILNELKTRMNLEIDENSYHQMTSADVKQQINLALDQLISPIRVKEHLVAQLKTQVDDLERFIHYLQTDTNGSKCTCRCTYHSIKKPFRSDTIGIIQRTATLLQMFAVLQLGCGPHAFKRNDLKTSMKGNHWGDLRARLEMSIHKIKELVVAERKYAISECDSDDLSEHSSQLTAAVRKHLAPSIRDLMQHGATQIVNNTTLVPFIGCFPRKLTENGNDAPLHAWEIVLEYYHLKNGEKFNSTPARKLSQSFNLDIAGASAISNKHNMLCTIGNIISTHAPYKRSYDSNFKAFISAALNANKLVTWLALIYQSNQIIKLHYYPWSYVVKTGFQDSLKSLEVLTPCSFNLPVDLAIRQFQNIKDVFT